MMVAEGINFFLNVHATMPLFSGQLRAFQTTCSKFTLHINHAVDAMGWFNGAVLKQHYVCI